MTTKSRPEILQGKTIKAKTDCGSLYVTLNTHEDELFEVRLTLGKVGNCVGNLLHVISILISILLQSGLNRNMIKNIINKHLREVSCGTRFYHKGKDYNSCSDLIADIILEELSNKK